MSSVWATWCQFCNGAEKHAREEPCPRSPYILRKKAAAEAARAQAGPAPEPVPVASAKLLKPRVTPPVTPVIESVTPVTGEVTHVTVSVADGSRCPTCGQRIRRRHPSLAAKQRAYRDRKKEKRND